MLEYLPERSGERMSEYLGQKECEIECRSLEARKMSDIMSECDCQQEFEIECQGIFATKNVR